MCFVRICEQTAIMWLFAPPFQQWPTLSCRWIIGCEPTRTNSAKYQWFEKNCFIISTENIRCSSYLCRRAMRNVRIMCMTRCTPPNGGVLGSVVLSSLILVVANGTYSNMAWLYVMCLMLAILLDSNWIDTLNTNIIIKFGFLSIVKDKFCINHRRCYRKYNIYKHSQAQQNHL